MVSLWIVVSPIAIGIIMLYFSPVRKQPEPKKLVAKFIFGKEGKKLGEFFYPTSLAIKDNHLYVADSDNQRIQILKINPDGSLSSKFTFGKEGKGLGEFSTPTALTIKENYLFVADSANSRIQVLEIKFRCRGIVSF